MLPTVASPRLPLNQSTTHFATLSTRFIMPKTPLKANSTGFAPTNTDLGKRSTGLGQMSISRSKPVLLAFKGVFRLLCRSLLAFWGGLGLFCGRLR